MKSALLSIISATVFVAGVSAQSSLTVNTPLNVVVCEPLQISWAGGTPPYFLSIHPGATPDDPAVADFGTQNGTSFTWAAVNFAVGTSLDITLRDSNGLISQSAPFTVETGSSTSCLNGTASSLSTPAGTTAATTTGTGTTPTTSATSATTPTTTGTGTTPKGTTSTGKSSSASSTATSATTKNAAMSTSVSYGIAGVLGAVVAAVLA